MSSFPAGRRGWHALLSLLAAAALTVTAVTCADLTAPAGLRGTVAMSYAGPPIAAAGTIRVIIGQRLSPAFQVTLSGIPQSRVRYRFSLADPQDATVLKIFGGGGDSVEVIGRGSATLVATLLVAAVGADTAHRASINVIATPASNRVDSASLTFGALTATKELKGSSLKSDGSSIALNSSSLAWTSANPAVAAVTKLTDSTSTVTAVANGSTTIIAVFDGVDTVTVPVTVTQTFAPAQSTIAPDATSLVANGATSTTITVQLKDANGNNLVSGGASVVIASTLGAIGGVTDRDGGRYTATLTTGTTSGTATVTATVDGTPVSTSALVTFTASDPAKYFVTSNVTTANLGSPVLITAQLQDTSGNPVAIQGRTVAWTATGPGGTFATPTSLTDANGQAQIAYAATVAGTHTVRAQDNTALTGVSGDITISNLLPTLTNVSPAAGNRLATISVTLTGTNFVPGTSIDFGAGIAVSNVNVTSATSLTVDVAIASTAATGPRSVMVTNPAPGGGSATLAGAFSVTNPPPTLTARTPTSGTRLQTLDVTLTGAGFIAGVSAVNVSAGLTVNSTTVTSQTQIVVRITIAATATTGNKNISVTNAAPGGGTSGNVTLAVNNPAPTFTAVAPANAERLATLNVVFTGTGFIQDVTTVNVGPGITVNGTPTVNSPTQLTANITVTAAAAAGARDFTVANPAPGGGSDAQSFTVGTPVPTLTSIAPASASRLQTLDIVFTGSGFIDGVSTVNVGPGITVNATTVNGPSQITANITVTGAAALGARTFTVTNGPAGTSGGQTFTVVNNPAPTLTALGTTSGNRLQTLDVVFTGTGFIQDVSTVNVGAGITVNGTPTVNSPTQLTANITIGAAAALGGRNFTVTNAAPGGGTTAAQTFTVNNPAPTLTALGTTSGNRLQTLNVVFTGTGFIAGVSSVTVGADITLNSTTVNSATQITASITITAAAATGARNSTVTNAAPGGGTSATQSFTVNNPPPTLTALGTTSGNRLQTLDVVFTGTNFIAGVSTVNVGTGITVNTTTINSATQLTANLTITAAAATGARNFTVTNAAPGGGMTATQAFTVNNPAPSLASIAPASGNRLQQLNVVFTGTNFVVGVSAVNVGAGITVNSTTVDSPTQITANLTITGAAATGPRTFSVTTPAPGGGTTATLPFTVNNPTQTLTGIAPASGNRLQTLNVVFTGTGFVDGASSVDVGAGITVNSTTVNSATQITANITITETAATGPRPFRVTNTPGGTSAPQTFTVNNPTPALASITPTTGNRLQTLNVVFTGANFIAGVSTVNVGAGITLNTTTVDSPNQLTASITIIGAATFGVRAFSVTNGAPGGGTSATQGFTVLNNPAPTLTGIAPAGGTRLQTLDLVLTGSGFIAGVSTVTPGSGITVNTTTVNGPTQITANVTISATATIGDRGFTVTNASPGGGTSGPEIFTVTGNPVPTLTSLGTTSGNRLQALSVVFNGTGFIQGQTTVNVGAGITVTGTTVNSTTQLTANITIGAGAATGARNFSVTNAAPGGGASATQSFTVSNPAPTLTALGTTSGNRLQTLNVVFTGTGFISGASTVIVGAGITVNTTTVNSATQITANLTITAVAATGPRTFSVTNAAPGGGTSGTQAFTVNNPAPTLSIIAPTTANRLQQLDVVFTGTNFIAGVSTVNVGPDITVNTTTVNSATQLTANITIAPSAALGARTFSVTNALPGGGTSATQSFTVNNPAQTLTAIAPTTGDRLQTLNVVFTGTGFVPVASTVDVGPGITVNTTTVNSATQITANITITAAAAAGARNFTVTNTPGGTSGAADLHGREPGAHADVDRHDQR